MMLERRATKIDTLQSISSDFDALAATLSDMRDLEPAGSSVATRLAAAEAAARRVRSIIARHLEAASGPSDAFQ